MFAINSYRKISLIRFVLSLFFLVPVGSIAQQAKGLKFAERFADLPLLKKGVQTYQFSSTDPKEDQFNDYDHWLYSDADSNAVLADIRGPGTVYRIWSTGNRGDSDRIRVFVDGQSAASIDQTFNQFHDRPPLRQRPQVGAGGDHYLAWWSYLPISFKHSLRIERQGNFRPFYSITYHSYTNAEQLDSFNGQEDMSKTESLWNDVEQDPKDTTGNFHSSSVLQIPNAESRTVFEQRGSGYIAALRISNYVPDKNLRLKIYWDDNVEPAVDAPVKWFFGSIDNGGDLKALGVGTVGNNGYCYFPMPYWKNAKIVLENKTGAPTGDIQVQVDYNSNAYPQEGSGYFYAVANEVEKPGKSYRCLSTKGQGHVIGMAKRMPKGGHACEADEIYFIDGRHFPDIYGTGEEDYSNNAWWQNSYNSYPTHGCIGNDCYYRLHYPDMLVFSSGIDMEFESWQNFYIASLVWFYKKDEEALTLTDQIDIGNSVAEKAHRFRIEGQTWSGKDTGYYPGIRIYKDSTMDDGRSFQGSTSFTVNCLKENEGVRLRVKTRHLNGQEVKVFVNGREVTERSWVIMKNNFEALWVDSDFEIPASYTQGKSKLKIWLETEANTPDWTAYNYEVYSYKK